MIDTAPTFEFPAVRAKKITAAFDGGRISSDGGVMLLAGIERRLGIADRLAELVPDRRDPSRVTHRLADMIRARLFAICCGYERWCMDPELSGIRSLKGHDYFVASLRRTDFGRAHASIRLRTAQPMAASVC